MSDTKQMQLLHPAGQLSELEELVQAEVARDERAYQYQPPRYKVAAQVGMFQNVLDDADLLPVIDGVVLLSRITRALWDNRAGNGDGDGEESRVPRCASIGGVTGEWRNEDGTTHRAQCGTCPYNQWGSEVRPNGAAGRGKACKEMRRFALLIDGQAGPVMLTIPPTSCKAFDQYASALANRKSAYFAVRTRIALEKAVNPDGIRYSVATFTTQGPLPQEHVAWVVGMRRSAEEYIGVAPEYEEYVDGNGHPGKDPGDPDAY